jgi:hypothetical protein
MLTLRHVSPKRRALSEVHGVQSADRNLHNHSSENFKSSTTILHSITSPYLRAYDYSVAFNRLVTGNPEIAYIQLSLFF